MLSEMMPFREKGWKVPRFRQYPLGNAHKEQLLENASWV
jgi:hypothetical protein